MQVEFLGQSALIIDTNQEQLIIDPFLKDNPLTDKKVEEIKAQWILITHGHSDHLGDALSIAKNNKGVIIAPYELAMYCSFKGADVHPMHIGGQHQFSFGKVKLTPALHGSAVIEDQKIIYTGNPCGFLIEIAGKTIYHAGDTGLFSDMALIPQGKRLDLAVLPIGDNFVMGPEDALKAVEYLQPRQVLPMHYDTFPLIEQDPHAFVAKLPPHVKGIVLQPGGKLEL